MSIIEEEGMFVWSHNEDNVSVQGKVWVGLLTTS